LKYIKKIRKCPHEYIDIKSGNKSGYLSEGFTNWLTIERSIAPEVDP